MILVEAGPEGMDAFEAKVLFAGALAAAGYRAVIDDRTIPPDLPADLRYEAAPYLCDLALLGKGQGPDHLIVIGGARIEGQRATALRGVAPTLTRVALVGRFGDRHERTVAVARIAHAVGCEPVVVDESEVQPFSWPIETALPLWSAAPVGAGARAAPDRLRLLLAVSPDLVDDPGQRGFIAALAQMPRVALRVMLPRWADPQIEFLAALGIAIDTDCALSAAGHARRADVVAFAGTSPFTQRAAAVGVAALMSGAVLLDMTPEASLCSAGVPALRASPDIGALGPFLETTLAPNFARIADMAGKTAWAQGADIRRLEEAIGLTRPERADRGTGRTGTVWFLPTNGVGLGHARRSARIAGMLPDQGRVAFLAHSSCAPLLARSGRPVLDLVSRSHDHLGTNAPDVVNYLRLLRVLKCEDLLIFDGNQIFDSVMRALGETGARCVWVRRGLWQPGQASVDLLARERAVARIIVPREAFDELNSPLSWGAKLSAVGPVVEPLGPGFDRGGVRHRLATVTGRGFRRLIVSMLGGARPAPADRIAQSTYLCQLAERMPDTLHLMLAWPGSVVDRGLHGWQNSRLVHTFRAPEIAAAADAVVSAAGYNNLHEAMYNRVPTIFMPQMAPYMDDQNARAEAAMKRGLALRVKADDLLTLRRMLHEMLEGQAGEMRGALSKAILPPTGTSEAAGIILAEAEA